MTIHKTVQLILLLFLPLLGYSQTKNQVQSAHKMYQPEDLNLNYSYTDSSQVLNLSNNWDFDGDSINDSLYFIGTGGAHLYFHPSIILSSQGITKNINYITTDSPVYLTKAITLNGFNVNHDIDGRAIIVMYIDRQSVSPELSALGITNGIISIQFINGKIHIKQE